MSLARVNEDAKYFGDQPGYVYVTNGQLADYEFNHGIRELVQFCELAMRALAQSGELTEDELETCESAFRARFDFVFNDE